MEVVRDLMIQQKHFESTIYGTDGDLSTLNTFIYALTRGVIGEAEEAKEAFYEGDIEGAKEEMADVLIFICTAFNHLGMTYEEVCELSAMKMNKNYTKYYSDPDRDVGLTIEQVMAKRKREWNEIVIYDSEAEGE